MVMLYYETYIHILQCTYFVLQLYGEFAEVFDLYECKLAIVHCAGHEDAALVDSLWQNIITKGVYVLCMCLCVSVCQCLCLFVYVHIL